MAGNDDFLSRWSRRKTQARVGATAEPEPRAPAAAPAASAAPGVPEADRRAAVRPALPDVESLTTESDFQPFMAPGVDPGLRRAALKTLFADPRYNVMDMLDTYVDDYSKPDPLPEGWLEKLEQVSRLGDRAERDRVEAARQAALAEEEAAAAAGPEGEDESVVTPAVTPEAVAQTAGSRDSARETPNKSGDI